MPAKQRGSREAGNGGEGDARIQMMLQRYRELKDGGIHFRSRPLLPSEKVAWSSELQSSRFSISSAPVVLQHAQEALEAHLKIDGHSLEFIYVVPLGASGAAAPAYRLPQLQRAAARAAAAFVQFGRPGHAQRLRFVIVPCKDARFWPKGSQKLAAEHINGAFTYRNGTDVFIFREEEYAKVMLHETLHHSIYDPTYEPAFHPCLQQLEAYLKSDGLCPQIASPILVSEGIVEAFATFLHAHFLANDVLLPFSDIWKREQQWAAQQAARLVACIDAEGQGRSDATEPRARGDRGDRVWSENTNAVAYLLVRCICMADIDSCRKALDATSPVQLVGFFHRHTPEVLGNLRRMKPAPILSLRMTLTGNW